MAEDEKEQKYFNYKDFLSEEDAVSFFSKSHDEQIQLFENYLNFLQHKNFSLDGSKKKSISYAVLQSPDEQLKKNVLDELIAGKTKSGFGAVGTPEHFLTQKELSMKVARLAGKMDHRYVVEQKRSKKKMREKESTATRRETINSRSFFFYWCHAEKQKIVDIRDKLKELSLSLDERKKYWSAIVVIVDRGMCADCIAFMQTFAVFENIELTVFDLKVLRVFKSDGLVEIIDDVHLFLNGGKNLNE